MNKKTKNKIMGIIIKSCLSFSMLWSIVWLIVAFKYGETSTYSAICVSILMFFIFLSLFLLYKFPEAMERPKVKAHEFPLNISNFNDFIKYLNENIKLLGYEKFPYLNNYNELACVYYKKNRDTLEFYSVYHFDEIKESKTKTFEYADKLMEEFFNSYYQGQKIKDFFKYTIIIWVDKENKTFKEIVNTNLDQGNYDGFLIVGVSPSNKTIYVADQKSGNNKYMYCELRNNFLKVMNLSMKDRIKNK